MQLQTIDLDRPEAEIERLAHPTRIDPTQKQFCQYVRYHIRSVVQSDGERREVIAGIGSLLQLLPQEIVYKVSQTFLARGIFRTNSNEVPPAYELLDQKDAERAQEMVRNPDGITKQCYVLGKTAQHIGERLQMPMRDLQYFVTAALLLNSGKIAQIVGGKKDQKELQPSAEKTDATEAMLVRYERREQKDYNLLEQRGFAPEVIAMLRENVRHDPSKLTSLPGKLLYYFIYCFNPNDGVFVPVEERVPKAVAQDKEYDEYYAAYTLRTEKDLLEEHRTKVDEIESEIASRLSIPADQTVREYLNKEVLGLTS